MTIWALRATIGQEKALAKHIRRRIEHRKIGVFSLLIPESLRGYIFIESDSIEHVDAAIIGVPHVRSKVVGEVDVSELESFLVPKPTIEGLHINDIIEIISGPFKGSRAKINRIDVGREEVTVELLDSQIPIPITLHSDFCKVIESAPSAPTPEDEDLLAAIQPDSKESKREPTPAEIAAGTVATAKSSKAGAKKGASAKKGEKDEEDDKEEDIFDEFFKA